MLTWEHKSRHFTGKCFLFASPFLPITVHFLSGCLASAYCGSIVPPTPYAHAYTQIHKTPACTQAHILTRRCSFYECFYFPDVNGFEFVMLSHTASTTHNTLKVHTPLHTVLFTYIYTASGPRGAGGGADRVTNVMWYTRSHTTCNAVWEMCSDLFVSIAAIVIQ